MKKTIKLASGIKISCEGTKATLIKSFDKYESGTPLILVRHLTSANTGLPMAYFCLPDLTTCVLHEGEWKVD